MRKFIKIIAVSLSVLVGLMVLATLSIRVLYPPAKLRRLVEEQIRRDLHREAQLGGVQVGIGGLTLSRFKLSEVPSFSAGTFLAVDEMDVRWAWLPLLSKQVLINAIILDKPQINLIRRADGKTLNISDLSTVTAPPSVKAAGVPVAAAARTGAWSWRVDEIHLRHGAIQFSDRSPAKQTSALSDIELILRGFNPARVQGRLTIGQLQNPVYTARDFSAEWSLHEIDPTLGHLNGWIRLKQGRGLIQNLSNLVNSSRGAKLALLPLVMLQNIDRLGFIRLGLPDFSRLSITRIDGDYGFKEGTMRINTFEIVSPQLSIGALGAIELASGGLAVDVTLNTPQPTLLGEMNLKMHISGTLSHPKTNVGSLKKKAFKATVKQLLNKPDFQKNINDTLKNIFH